ncbi:riboflavin biosynthesis protein RibF [uncultured Dialister sp.]|jgi:riboflavin kinase/FMN adenylyltransferase|uniref:riboflavin biosynthesis protein RibF n=1 Tax=Dialister sp. TaxID=1955814 RepID=UPI0025D9EEFB|nr:riboflavin biosynthesis protein RibF [uncultured Dialister sp.]
MVIYHSLKELPKGQKYVLALGFFDGCHRGHRQVFAKTKEMAHSLTALPGVLTFWPHPMAVLSPDIHVPLLQDRIEKERSFEAAGMKLALFLEPNREFLQKPAETFLEELAALPGLAGIVTGENFTFGHGALGKSSLLLDFFRNRPVKAEVVRLISEDGKIVSSTAIRRLIQHGNMEEAARLLGRPYTTSGDIVHGFHRGTDILGFPTANLELPENRVCPADGVYATEAIIGGRTYPAITNVGTNPTFGNEERTIETFIFHFDESIYGSPFTLRWIRRLRGEIRFPSTSALREQIEKDVLEAKKVLGTLD